MLKRLVAVVTFLACPCLSALADPHARTIQREDAAILRVVLSSQCQAQDGFELLSSKTIAPRERDDMGEADESGAFADLKRRNDSTTSLPESVACRGARLHPKEEIQGFFDRESIAAGKASLDEAWKKLYESFPGATGWTAVSLPGYSPDGDIAVVYVAEYCGSLCGKGFYVYLRRTKDRWQVLIRFPVWVS
ncbi:hypothetical protein [Dyella jiangningensis]|uniref:hypothetical protein n=1 Tax=Dyella jiangningensis TaxID=1379159 RepID=UPI0011BF5DE9|nr:hypothetical protein [Dyella jiangningensis]